MFIEVKQRMRKIRKGSTPAIFALFAIPLVLGVAAYAAGNPLLNGLMDAEVSHECYGMHEPTYGHGMHGAGYGEWVRQNHMDECEYHTMDRQMIRLHESQETKTVEGIVTDVTSDMPYIQVEDINGTLYTVAIGGRWIDETGSWIPYYELQAKLSPGTVVNITGFLCPNGHFRATEIVVDGFAYIWQTGGPA